MNRLKLFAKVTAVFCLIAVLFVSCSDDDDPQVSKRINNIEIWKTDGAQSYLQAYINLSYDNKSLLNRVTGDDTTGKPLVNIDYTYPDKDKFEFLYTVENSSLIRISGDLENGRVYSCKFTNKDENINYSYDNAGFLKRSEGKNIKLEYEWKDGNLVSIKASERGYNTEFKPTSIPNDYGFDLNLLPQLIAGSDYMEVMNTYCWMAGILGKKSRNLVEETLYSYNYMYDGKGRLAEVTLIKRLSSAVDSYSFKLKYDDNK